MLGSLKAGGYIVAPLIQAAGESGSKNLVREVNVFIASMDPSSFEIKPLVELLKDKNSQTRLSAAKALGNMSKKAESAMPDIFEAMQAADNLDEYSGIYDAAAMINPRIATVKLIVDMKDAGDKAGAHAFEKLSELYVYLGKKSEVRKQILPAFVRLLYSTDEKLAKRTEEMLAAMNDSEATQAIKAYIKMQRTLVKSVFNWTGTKMQEIFDRQESDLKDELTVYYKLIGREDALKTIKTDK